MANRPLLYCGLLAPVAFLAGVLVEGATRPAYSPWRHAVSQLSLGPGWPTNVALILVGATGLTVAVAYALTVVLSSLDQAGLWTNAPAGLTERVALIAGFGWCALLAGRLLEAAARHPLSHPTTARQA